MLIFFIFFDFSKKIKIFKKYLKKEKENHIWNQRQKLHYRRKFHQNQTSYVEGRRSNVKFFVKNKIEKKSKKNQKNLNVQKLIAYLELA